MTANLSQKAKKEFNTNEYIVYPAHGVGLITDIEEEIIAGFSLELFVINFKQEKMVLRVPTNKAKDIGMRKLSDSKLVQRSYKILRGKQKIKRTMWSRRAQEYDAKINSGDLLLVSEVVRDLFRAERRTEQSYSERQLFEAALDRMAREIAAIHDYTYSEAISIILGHLDEGVTSKKAQKNAEEAQLLAEASKTPYQIETGVEINLETESEIDIESEAEPEATSEKTSEDSVNSEGKEKAA